MAYNHILVTTDFSAESNQVIERSCALQSAYKSKLQLVHVLEPLNLAYGADSLINLNELQERIESEARTKIAALAKQFDIDLAQCHILSGGAASEIHSFAEREAVDLIVAGSHGRSGLALLLGSTANALLHGAKCDVLAVRIKE